MESAVNPQATSPKVDQGLSQLRLGSTDAVKVVNPYDPQANIWTGPRYLAGLLAKFGYRLPLASAADNAARRVDRHQALPPIQETQASVREVCHNFLKYAQEQHPKLGQVKPGSGPLTESNQLSYCFPVAPPFSFRDSWGDCRSRGRYHHAVDIFAWEGTPVYAITTGVIHQLAIWPEAGISLLLRGQDGYGYGYMHLQGYATGIVEGKTVQQGELIAYVGRTGIQQSTAHLHLQVYRDHRFARDEPLNPYGLLVQLSNGQGVTDLGHPRIARLQIPAVEVINSGTVRLSGSVPFRYQGSQRSVEDASTLFIDTF
jgi:murein DD-endopeptidase MepM/ murein hydrolase activator NlpD